MNPHDTLTEPSLLTHRRKGREGKGSRKRNRAACGSMHRHLGDVGRAPIGTRAPNPSASMHGVATRRWGQR